MKLRAQEEEKKLFDLTKELEGSKEQLRMSESHNKHLEEELKALQKQLFDGNDATPAGMSRLSQMASANDAMDAEASASVEQVIETRDLAVISDELRSLDKKAAMQREHNAQLFSKILSLQGNIQVCCRVRPLRVSEIQSGVKNNVEALSETELGCYDARHSKWKSFSFGKVWGPDQNQKSIFGDVEPLGILSVVDWYNACIFSYGQTGSGKTYTMDGSADNNNYGVSYRTINKIFTLLNLRSQQQRAAYNMGTESKEFTFKLQLGMLEICWQQGRSTTGGQQGWSQGDARHSTQCGRSH